MSQVSASSSSCVKVEYHDPHDCFKYISSEFDARIPLRNLNWNTKNRPLRLIDKLFITLEPANTLHKNQAETNLTAPFPNSENRTVNRSTRNRGSDDNLPPRERRHQIPGLQQTPYLKLLLIKCDDTESYKSQTRKEIRDWIKSHTPPSQKSTRSSKQENHAAFEWMILHVVTPGSDGRVVWPERNSNKIIAYLRDDFNGSSKSSIDRISQVPSLEILLSKEDSAPTLNANLKRQADEAWEDVLGKFKQLILASFDLRVRQYEEDIKEKGNQKSLPGWNFNTFFILKEGLARGFENVGLVEDALSGYDELQVELDAAVYSKRNTSHISQDATIFRDSSPEIEKICANDAESNLSMPSLFKDRLSDAERGRYRDLILSNDISVFDFKTFVFVRQLTLLQRLGSYLRTGTNNKINSDPKFFCEICKRAMAFVAATGAVLRYEANLSLQRNMASKSRSISQNEAISQTVSAWTYNVLSTVLQITDIGEDMKLESVLRRPESDKSQNNHLSDKPLPQWQDTSTIPVNSGALLANCRANLFRTVRKALEDIAASKGWLSRWDAVSAELCTSFWEDAGKGEDYGEDVADRSSDGWDTSLANTLVALPKFQESCITLTSRALEHHLAAGDSRSAKIMQMDLVAYKFLKRCYSEVLQSLSQYGNEYLCSDWLAPQSLVMRMQGYCYRKTGDQRGYIKSCLNLLKGWKGQKEQSGEKFGKQDCKPDLFLIELMEAAKSLQEEIVVNLQDFAEHIAMSKHIQHLSEPDILQMTLYMNSAVLSGIVFDKVIVQMVPTDPRNHDNFELSAHNQLMTMNASQNIDVQSCSITPGIYRPKRASLNFGNIKFVYDFNKRIVESAHGELTNNGNVESKTSDVLIWLPPKSLDVSIQASEQVDLERLKSIMMTIHLSNSRPHTITLRIRSGTSGLRLHTAQAAVTSGKCNLEKSTKPGSLKIDCSETSDDIKLTIPFQTEQDVKDIIIRTETRYEHSGLTHQLERTHKMSVLLPLGVNVQDIFKSGAIFSKFSISTSNRIPLKIVDYDLQDIPGYILKHPSKNRLQHLVAPKHPSCLIYKIKSEAGQRKANPNKPKLRLKLAYRCLDDEILHVVREKLLEGLKTDNMTQYKGLLGEHIQERLVAKISDQELESAALTRKVHLVSYEALEWQSLLAFIPLADSQRLAMWLRSWHQKNCILLLPEETEGCSQRTIHIPVDVPPMQVIQWASLDIVNVETRAAWRIGDTIPAEVRLKYSRRWEQFPDNVGSQIEVTFELDAVPDSWMIGGQRRATFEPEEDKEYRFSILLLPQRIGHLPLPTLEIRIKDVENKKDIQCDLDYRSQGETLLITPKLASCTAGVAIRPDRRSALIDTM